MAELVTSRENPTVKYMAKLLSSAKARREEGRFVVEGARLCADAALSGCEIEILLYTEKAEEKYPSMLKKIRECASKQIKLSGAAAAVLGDTQAPQGVFCLCRTLDKPPASVKMNKYKRLLLLEDIQDPQNLGTILRTAEALGFPAAVLSGGCCDRYSPKVLRGSMGAVFRLPCLVKEDFSAFIGDLRREGYFTAAAVLAEDAVPVTYLSFPEKAAVAVGNEGNGLKEQTVAACEEQITIPMGGRAESLNAAVAASILMWEMMRP